MSCVNNLTHLAVHYSINRVCLPFTNKLKKLHLLGEQSILNNVNLFDLNIQNQQNTFSDIEEISIFFQKRSPNIEQVMSESINEKILSNNNYFKKLKKVNIGSYGNIVFPAVKLNNQKKDSNTSNKSKLQNSKKIVLTFGLNSMPDNKSTIIEYVQSKCFFIENVRFVLYRSFKEYFGDWTDEFIEKMNKS